MTQNEILISNINSLIRNSKYSKQKIANMVGVSRQSLHKWMSGETIPSQKYIDALADIFEINSNMLYVDQTTVPEAPQRLIPLINGIDSNGNKIMTSAYTEPYLNANNLSVESTLCYKMPDMSMVDARITKEDIVLIQENTVLENGAIILVSYNRKLYLRKYINNHGKIILRCANNNLNFYDFVIDKNDNLEIIGKAVAFRSML